MPLKTNGEYEHSRQYVMPKWMVSELLKYVVCGNPMVRFWRAALSNDLYDAMAVADGVHATALQSIVAILYYEVPPACRGSRDTYDAWLALSHADRLERIGESRLKEYIAAGHGLIVGHARSEHLKEQQEAEQKALDEQEAAERMTTREQQAAGRLLRGAPGSEKTADQLGG